MRKLQEFNHAGYYRHGQLGIEKKVAELTQKGYEVIVREVDGGNSVYLRETVTTLAAKAEVIRIFDKKMGR